MLPLKDKDRPIVCALLDAGCCARCVLRFCCVSLQSAYRRPYEDLMLELQNFISAKDIDGTPDATEKEDEDSPPCKKIRVDAELSGEVHGEREVVTAVPENSPAATLNICVVCLGVLQDFCDENFAKKVAETVKSQKYEFDSLVLSVSLPAQLSVREAGHITVSPVTHQEALSHLDTHGNLHSAWLLIRKEVREKGVCLGKDDIVQVKEAYKWILHGLVSRGLGVPVVAKSPFEVSVGFVHPETDADCHFLASTCSDCFKPAKNKLSVFTRMAVAKALEKISEDVFRRKFPCPPRHAVTRCTVQEIQCLHVSVFVAGRYNKFSRTLPQTPWVIDGERRMESSVEELITALLVPSFRADGFNFSSSGREDVDVRTLGNGRPFAVELLNPHRAKFSPAEIRQLEETINRSSDKIKVRDLQIVTRDAVGHMKEGEEEKTKSYRALIWTRRPIDGHDIEFLNDVKDLGVDQKTPLRVLHRRPLAVRRRVIHTMSVQLCDAHHFHLRLRTQAGTYIKEFVHGDFGRTKPSLGELMKTDTDILELDVESVDVDWPPSLEPEESPNPQLET